MPHQWSGEQKIVLCLTHLVYHTNAFQQHLIFNEVFKTDLFREGLPDGLQLRVLVAQLAEIKGRSSHRPPWAILSAMSSKQIRAHYSRERGLIEDAAETLEIQLRLRLRSPVLQSNAPERQEPEAKNKLQTRTTIFDRLVRNTTPTSTFSDMRTDEDFKPNSSDSDSDEDNTPSKPPRQRCNVAVDRHLPLTVIRYDHSGTRARTRPLLLFRAFQLKHGFQSRQYSAMNTHFPPPAYESRKFGEVVWPHLNVETTYLSPFISFANGALNAMRRVKDDTFGFSIFSFNDIEASARDMYGPDAGPYLVRDICSVHDIQNLPKGYTGVGEWLAWLDVQAEPIVVLDYATTVCLRRALENTEIDRESGIEIGQCLTGVSEYWREVVAYKLLLSSKITGLKKGNIDYNDFVDGLYSINDGDRAASVMPNIDLTQMESPTELLRFVDNDWRSDTVETPTREPRATLIQTPHISDLEVNIAFPAERVAALTITPRSENVTRRLGSMESVTMSPDTPITSPPAQDFAEPTSSTIEAFKDRLEPFVARANTSSPIGLDDPPVMSLGDVIVVDRDDGNDGENLVCMREAMVIDLTASDEDDIVMIA